MSLSIKVSLGINTVLKKKTNNRKLFILFIDIDTDFIKAENKSVVNYLINKNIFGVIQDKDNLAI